MRPAAGPIWDAWTPGGPFIADRAPHGRVTVEKDWWLNVQLSAGSYQKCPIRWFQREDGSQVETEVPNVKSIDIDRSIDTDAGSATINVYNQKMLANAIAGSGATVLGQPGYYTWRFRSSEANARWGPGPGEEWRNVLVPDALLRSYEGYGGLDKTIPEAVADGNLVLTGLWLVDTVKLTSAGMIELRCRDMAKLLIEQHLYPPLVPAALYPHGLRYCRWNPVFHPAVPATPGSAGAGNKRCVYSRVGASEASGSDVWQGGFDRSLHGHFPHEAFDADDSTFWLSVGNDSAEEPFAVEWIEAACGDEIDSVFVNPWAGNYRCYVSVMVDGAWVDGGLGVIPYDPAGIGRYNDANAAGIPFVAQAAVPMETATTIALPRAYVADKVRFTFSNLYRSQWGPYPFRAGVRRLGLSLGSQRTGATSGSAAYTTQDDGNYRDYCLDEESEVLTRRGWLKHGDLALTDQVLGIDPERNQGVWQPVESIYRRDVTDRRMVRMHGASFDALTTPDHRWLVRFGQDERWRWTTSDALRTTDLVPLAVPAGHTPSLATHDDDFVELVAWFWTEGSWGSSATFSQSPIVNPGNVARIRRLMERRYGPGGPMPRGRAAPRPGKESRWNENTRKTDGHFLYRLDKGIKAELQAVLDEEKVPSMAFLLSLTQAQLRLFLDVSMMADGHTKYLARLAGRRAAYRRRSGADPASTEGHTRSFPQNSERRTRAFEIAALLAGEAVTTHRSRDGRRWTAQLLACRDAAPVRSASQAGRFTITEERYTGTIWCPTVEHGNFLARRNGSSYVTGNSDIIKDLALWAGFYLYDGTGGNPKVFGNIESTGIADTGSCILEDQFAKKTVIDAMHLIRDIVSYLLRVDEEGGFRFESPNYFKAGNFDMAGAYVPVIPEIDEAMQLTDYSVVYSDAPARTDIIISSDEPTADLSNTVTTHLVPEAMPLLRGIVRPLMFINGFLTDPNDQLVMARLIDREIRNALVNGSVGCAANPCIGINDQVKIHERVTSETGIHYITGCRTSMDLDTGSYLMTLTTYRIGDEDGFVVTA